MQVLFHGRQNSQEIAEGILSIIKMFRERYGIENFREIQLSMTLMDNTGDEVELVDSETAEVFRIFEVVQSEQEPMPRSNRKPKLKLVVDNT